MLETLYLGITLQQINLIYSHCYFDPLYVSLAKTSLVNEKHAGVDMY